MSDTLERLRGYPNFQSWTFGPARSEAGARRRCPLPEGPWNDEPDKVQWIHPASNLDCLAVRNHFGAWCGYVGVPPEHPLHGQGYGMVDVDVHGGLTFADFCADSEEPEAICHVAAPGRPDRVWWLGFDCGHAFDFQPGIMSFEAIPGMVYRDLAYVVEQVTQLAIQLMEFSRQRPRED